MYRNENCYHSKKAKGDACTGAARVTQLAQARVTARGVAGQSSAENPIGTPAKSVSFLQWLLGWSVSMKLVPVHYFHVYV